MGRVDRGRELEPAGYTTFLQAFYFPEQPLPPTGRHGRRDEALTAIQNAFTIRRRLAEANPPPTNPPSRRR
jgi:hypothetical protein